MTWQLNHFILMAGIGQLSVLIAAALVPLQLNWMQAFQSLSRLHKQMIWVYAGYIVLSITAFGLLSIIFADDLAAGSPLARGLCLFIAVFWGIRLFLQAIFDVKSYLNSWWLKTGYHLLTLLFLYFTVVFAWATFH